MALSIRLQRFGARNAPFYRVVVAESRFKRDGRFVELLGTYDPRNKKQEEQVNLKLDKIQSWIDKGAKPSDTVASLVRRAKREAAAQPAETETAEASA